MGSAEVMYWLKDVIYWLFENTLEPMGDLPWRVVLIAGFVFFAMWMKMQVKYNKQAAADPNQIK